MDDKTRYSQAQNPTNFTVQILTNLTCNLNCTYCYEVKTGKINTIENITPFIDYMFEENKDKDYCILDFIGGESFLVVDLLDEVVEYVRKKNKKFIISTCTNGTLFLQPKVQKFITKNKDIIAIGISIDGKKESHDKYRVYHDGTGTYDDIIKGLDFIFKAVPRFRLSVKSTYTKETFAANYYENMIHIINLGFTEIAGNITFEEPISLEFGFIVAKQFMRLADYILENDLIERVKLVHFYHDADFIRNYNKRLFGNLEDHDEKRNYCGSCNPMRCIGFDNKIYGCNRFLTMDKPNMELGVFENGVFNLYNEKLKNEVIEQYKIKPQECIDCKLVKECSSCVAAPYETDDVKAYIDEKRSCGWTYGLSLARFYLCSKLYMKEHKDK